MDCFLKSPHAVIPAKAQIAERVVVSVNSLMVIIKLMNDENNRPKRIAKKFNELGQYFDEEQRELLKAAMDAGARREFCSELSMKFSEVEDHPLFDNTEGTLDALIKVARSPINELPRQNDIFYAGFDSTAVTSASSLQISMPDKGAFINSGHSKAYVGPSLLQSPDDSWAVADKQENEEHVFNSEIRITHENLDKTANLLEKLDPEFKKIYMGVWETFFGAGESRMRSSLYLMREFFDQFLRGLAPDSDVRESEYFSEKKGDKRNQIYRVERVRYIANTHSINPNYASLLESQAEEVIAAYKELQKLHSPDSQDEEWVRKTLLSLNAHIVLWTKALGL